MGQLTIFIFNLPYRSFKTAQDGGRQEQAIVKGQEGWKEEGVSKHWN